MRNVSEYHVSVNSVGATAFAVATAAAIIFAADPALAQGVGVEAIPTGRFTGIASSTLGYICITIGIVCVACGLIYGLFQMLFRSEGVAIVVKSLLVGSFMGLVLPLAIWTVGSAPSTATIPQPGGAGGLF